MARARSSETFDVAVIGVGAMGSAACEALARRGVSVVGIERFDLPHDRGSSGGQSRLIRKAYWEHPDYVPLLHRAYENWRALEERSGAKVLVEAGCLYAGRGAGDLIVGTRRSASEHSLEVDEVSASELHARWPQFVLPEDFEVLYEAGAGLVLCERAIAIHAELAQRHGAQIRCRERLLSWTHHDHGVSLQTDRGQVEAGHVLFTAGAWAGDLLGDLGVRLRVHRQVIAWVWPEPLERYTLGALPCWAIEPPDVGFQGIYYGFPALPAALDGGQRGLKLGHHWLGPTTDPESVVRDVDDADEADWRPALERYLPGANGPVAGAKVCLYTSSPDEHFIVDRHPTLSNVTLACGFSGHGFKFASVMGEALADLTMAGHSDLPVGFLSLSRFQSGRP